MVSSPSLARARLAATQTHSCGIRTVLVRESYADSTVQGVGCRSGGVSCPSCSTQSTRWWRPALRCHAAEERKRLRQAHGLTLDDVAAALKVRRATVSGWESLKKPTEPRGPEREAYARLLNKLAELYPAPAAPAAFTGEPTPAESRTLSTAPASEAAAVTERENTQTIPAPAAAEQAAPPPARTSRSTSTSRRPGARKASPARTPAGGTDPRFENGPLAVVDVDTDGQVLAYCTGGLVLDVPAKSLPSLVDWTLKEAKLGQPKLSGPGKDADPLLVLTEAALHRYGL